MLFGRSGVSVAAGACALSLLAAGEANAHGETPAGVAPMFEDAAFIGGATSFGLVLRDRGGTWRWVAEEALGLTLRWQARMADGRVLAGTANGLMRTTDLGCSWAPVPGPLATLNVTDLALDPLDPGRMYATTSSGGVDNGVFVSTDAGQTWAARGELRPDSFFKRVIVAPDGATLWAAGLEAGTLAPFVLRSDDGGAWQGVAAPLTDPLGEPLEDFRLFRVGREPAVFYAAARIDGDDRLLRSLDALGSFEDLAGFGDPEITAVGVLDDAVFVALDGYELWRARGDAVFEQVEDGPAGCLTLGPEPGVLWACGDLRHGAGFLSTDDGEAWTAHLPFPEVCPRACDEGTNGYAANDALWEPLQSTWNIGLECRELGGGEDTGGDTDTGTDTGASADSSADSSADTGADSSADSSASGSCACALDRGPAPAGAALGVLALLALVRRRGG